MSDLNSQILAVIRELSEKDRERKEILARLKVFITEKYSVKEILTQLARSEITDINLQCYYSSADRQFFDEYRHTKQQDAASKDARKRHKKMAGTIYNCWSFVVRKLNNYSLNFSDNLRLKYNDLVKLRRSKSVVEIDAADATDVEGTDGDSDPEQNEPVIVEGTSAEAPLVIQSSPPERVEISGDRDCPVCLVNYPQGAWQSMPCHEEHILCYSCTLSHFNAERHKVSNNPDPYSAQYVVHCHICRYKIPAADVARLDACASASGNRRSSRLTRDRV
jgi:hypothetical protein